MRIFLKILPQALALVFFAQTAFAEEGIYDRDLVRGFLALKGGISSMKSDGLKFINAVTGESYKREYIDGHVEIGAEYHQFRTWFDVDFMPITPSKGSSEWFTYGVTWMWGYKLFSQGSIFNIIPSIGPGFELQNIRQTGAGKLFSNYGPSLNLEMELRLQASRFSFGVYGGYKIVRYDGWDNLTEATQASIPPIPRDVNSDKVFGGVKLSWTMLNNFQKRERDFH